MNPRFLPPSVREGLSQLYTGWVYARDLNVDPWEFAVTLDVLRAAGITENDLHWLDARGMVECNHSALADGKPSDPKALANGSDRIILTRAGARWARRMMRYPQRSPAPSAGLYAGAKPTWNCRLRVLSFDGKVVKRFRVPAPLQELVLSALQEEHWPQVIDDPLPPLEGICPKRRLHDVITALNRCHVYDLIHFSGTGTGDAVAWERRDAPQIVTRSSPPCR